MIYLKFDITYDSTKNNYTYVVLSLLDALNEKGYPYRPYYFSLNKTVIFVGKPACIIELESAYGDKFADFYYAVCSCHLIFMNKKRTPLVNKFISHILDIFDKEGDIHD